MADIHLSATEPTTQRPSSPTPSTSSNLTTTTTSHTAYSATSSSAPRTKAEHDFLLFSYLLRFVHREGSVGDFAREGLLHLVDIATTLPNSQHGSSGMTRSDTGLTITPQPADSTPTPSRAAREATLAFAEHLLDSDFAEVLGAGLGALYGLLPSKLAVRSADASAAPAGSADGLADMGGGMVLGGLGPLGDSVDAEELARQREDEEDRLRSLGYGISGTDNFRDALDGWLTLVEFTQEVLGRCRAVEEALRPGAEEEVEEEGRQQRFVMTALAASILGSLRSSLLENVICECKPCRAETRLPS